MSTVDSPTTTRDGRAAARAGARSAVHAGLSVLLAADEAGLDAVRERLLPFLANEDAGLRSVRRATNQLRAALGRRSSADLLRRHRALLPPVESLDLPAYESAYCGSDIFRQAQVMADIAGFYRAHGLVVGGSRRERPDHVAVELEFMALLTAKEADALRHLGPDQVAMCREAQALFLGEHLGRWAPLFARRLAERADGGPYLSVAELLTDWIAAELEEHGVPARPPAPMGELLPIVESAGGGCGIDAEGCPR